MSADEWGAVGLIVTIVLGVAGLLFAKKVSKRSQAQKIKGNGKAFQAGRDMTIGPDHD